VPGTTIQSYDATLAALADVSTSAETFAYFTGVDAVASTPLTATARTFLSAANVGVMRTQLGLQDLALLDTVDTAHLDGGAVTFAKMQSVTNQRLLGRSNATTGEVHEITVGTGLLLDNGLLVATGGGGGTTTVVEVTARKRIFMHMGS
jgi:hypothetical protein